MKKWAVGLAIPLVFLLTISPLTASALNRTTVWATSNNPLIAYGYSSTAWGYGTHKVSQTSNGTVAQVNGFVKIKNADNHKAFLSIEFQSNAGRCLTGTSSNLGYKGVEVGGGASWTCDQPFKKHKTATSTRITTTKGRTTSYETSNASAPVNHNGTASRAAVKVCLDIPWRTDPCTGWSYSGIDTY